MSLSAASVYTIGYTQKPAEVFFDLLASRSIDRVIDVRRKPNAPLAGFARQCHLPFLLDRVCSVGYTHYPGLAPSLELLTTYQKGLCTWPEYEIQFLEDLSYRAHERVLSPELFNKACLLCSEASPQQCHRRLVAEALPGWWPAIAWQVEHLE